METVELKELGFENKEQLLEAIEQAKKINELSEERERLNSRLQELEPLSTQVKTYEEKLGFYENNPFVKDIAVIANNNPDKIDTYLQLRSVDEGISNLDAYKLRLKLEKGFSQEEIEDEILILQERFGVDKVDLEDADEKKKFEQRINRHLIDNKKWLLDEKKKISDYTVIKPKVDDKEIEEAANTFRNPLLEQKSFIDLSVKNTDFTEEQMKEAGIEDIPLDINMTIEFDDELKQTVEVLTKDLIKKGKIKDPKNNLENINEYVILLAKGIMYDKHLDRTKKHTTFEALKTAKEYLSKKYSTGTTRTPYVKAETPKTMGGSKSNQQFTAPNIVL